MKLGGTSYMLYHDLFKEMIQPEIIIYSKRQKDSLKNAYLILYKVYKNKAGMTLLFAVESLYYSPRLSSVVFLSCTAHPEILSFV